jgi:hypothetical protein
VSCPVQGVILSVAGGMMQRWHSRGSSYCPAKNILKSIRVLQGITECLCLQFTRLVWQFLRVLTKHYSLKLKSRSIDEVIVDRQCGFGFNQLLIRFFWFFRYWRSEYSTSAIYRPKASLMIEFGAPMKLVTLINTCSNKTCSEVRIGNHTSRRFPVWNGLKYDAF